MLRPVSEVADMEHSRRHCVGFVRDLVKAGSVSSVEDVVEHVGLFFVVKKAGVQRYIVDAHASNRHFLRPPSGPLLAGEGLFHEEFQGALENAQRTGMSVQRTSRMRSIRCVSLDGYRRALHCPLFSHPKLATQVPPSTPPMGFSWAMFFRECRFPSFRVSLTFHSRYDPRRTRREKQRRPEEKLRVADPWLVTWKRGIICKPSTPFHLTTR